MKSQFEVLQEIQSSEYYLKMPEGLRKEIAFPLASASEPIKEEPLAGCAGSAEVGPGRTAGAIAIAQVKTLASFIEKHYPDEPGSQGLPESAVDCAIRMLNPERLNAYESILAFFHWWSKYEKVVTFQTGFNPDNMLSMIAKFSNNNRLPLARENYLSYLKV